MSGEIFRAKKKEKKETSDHDDTWGSPSNILHIIRGYRLLPDSGVARNFWWGGGGGWFFLSLGGVVKKRV